MDTTDSFFCWSLFQQSLGLRCLRCYSSIGESDLFAIGGHIFQRLFAFQSCSIGDLYFSVGARTVLRHSWLLKQLTSPLVRIAPRGFSFLLVLSKEVFKNILSDTQTMEVSGCSHRVLMAQDGLNDGYVHLLLSQY
jgi:hypothetical protein